MYLRYALWAPVSLAFNVLVMATCWLWAGIAAIGNLRVLPWPLCWVQTHDDDIYGSAMTGEPVPTTVGGRFKRACWWLCRNPGYTFDAYVLGYPAEGMECVSVRAYGTFDTGSAAHRDRRLIHRMKKRSTT